MPASTSVHNSDIFNTDNTTQGAAIRSSFLIPESICRTDRQDANRTIISMQRICKCCPKRSHTNDQNRFQNRIYLQDSQSLQYRQHNHADCQCKEYILAGKFQYMPFQDAIRRQIHCQIKRNLRNNRKSSSRPI